MRGEIHVIDHSHRDVTGGVPRAMVFGANDGLVSNVSLILGMAGASADGDVVRLAGIAGLIAGAVSMAAGEYISMRAQVELIERELDLERTELKRNPDLELEELAIAFERKGIPPESARKVAAELSRDPDRALEAHAREELGIDPGAVGSPVGASIGSFVAFSLGASIPLAPWLVTDGNGATVTSVLLALVAAAALGGVLAAMTTKRIAFGALRQAAIAAVASAVTFGIGSALGVGVS